MHLPNERKKADKPQYHPGERGNWG